MNCHAKPQKIQTNMHQHQPPPNLTLLRIKGIKQKKRNAGERPVPGGRAAVFGGPDKVRQMVSPAHSSHLTVEGTLLQIARCTGGNNAHNRQRKLVVR